MEGVNLSGKRRITCTLLLILLLGTGSGFAEEAQTTIISYVVSYLGIPILDMNQTLSVRDSLTTIRYDNQLKPLFKALYDLHNIYQVTFITANYRPQTWSKRIHEGDLDFMLSARRDPWRDRAVFDNGEVRPFEKDVHTIFSATHYLESIAWDETQFPKKLRIFVDGELWQAMVNRYAGPENSMLEDHPAGTVLLRAVLKRIGGRSVLVENDILTRHIATEGSLFLLWVDDQQHIIRARFGTFPTAVELDRQKN